MVLGMYRSLLRLPTFKGKSRLINYYRGMFFTSRTYRIIHGLRIEVDPIDWIQSDLIKSGCLEPQTSALFGHLLRPGDTYVDVGAHIGFHTLVARHFVGESGRVVAIEPQPYNCQKLLANWQLNGFDNLALYVAAVGDYAGTVLLHHQLATDTSCLSLYLEPVNDQPQVFYVPIHRLETILKEQKIERVRLMKMDVEGYELEAIEGIGSYMDAIDHLILEVLGAPSELSEKSLALIEKLKSLGFNLRTVDGDAWDAGRQLPENNLWVCRELN